MNHKALSTIFNPKIKCESSDLHSFLPTDRAFFFPYARSALKRGLYCSGLKRGATVLIPSFICADVLSSFFELDINVEFYGVKKDLECIYDDIDNLIKKDVKAILFVNYFGFPQPVSYLKDISQKKNLLLIEDNAHGFLSKDKDRLLGLRGDIGVFSLRKTVPMPNGAALVINNEELKEKYLSLENKNNLNASKLLGMAEIKYLIKEPTRPVMALGGIKFRSFVLDTFRRLKADLNGFDEESSLNNEKQVPRASFSSFSKRLLHKMDFQKEAERRRQLYLEVKSFIDSKKECCRLYENLYDGVVPYGYPFYYYGDDIKTFRESLWRDGLPSLNWPNLPGRVKASVPEFYNKIILIPFLW